MGRQGSAGLALVLIFLAAHLALLPKALEDVDSVNFALGVRHFDVARHQPHPPGYPVYIALSKASTGVLRAAGVDAPSPRGLAIWSALGGAAAIPAVFLLFRRLEGRDDLARWAALVLAASPLFWFTALRPLSDMLGFAAAMWVLALLGGKQPGRVVAGALLAGLAIGIRSQIALLTVPALALALATDLWLPPVPARTQPGAPARSRSVRVAVGALGAFAIGVLAWAIPFVVASGGTSAYLHTLAAQAGEDFSGVVMLWTHPTDTRLALHALVNTFIWPWDWWLGLAVCVLAAAGAAPAEGLPARALPVAAIGVAAIALMQALPASVRYAHEGAPVFRAFDDMAATAHGGDRVDAIALHAGALRAAEWSMPILPARLAIAPHGYEWLALVGLWQAEPSARAWFVADPDRTDLALFDPRARDLARAYRWGFVAPPFVGGARPDNIDWYRMQPPNWMLDRGWAITAEVGGVTAHDHSGPPAAPAIAWLKRQMQPITIVLGGRLLPGGGVTAARVTVTLPGAPIDSFPVTPGFFMRLIALPAGALRGSAPYVPLAISSEAAVSLEQFDAQPPGVPMFGYGVGWQEPEYSAETGQSWRWMSERAELWVRPVGRPVTLRIAGESPLRYFNAAPHVRVQIGDRDVAAFDPASDFAFAITLPADILERSNGRVALENSKFFAPGGAGGGGDQRHLALRIYRLSVE